MQTLFRARRSVQLSSGYRLEACLLLFSGMNLRYVEVTLTVFSATLLRRRYRSDRPNRL